MRVLSTELLRPILRGHLEGLVEAKKAAQAEAAMQELLEVRCK